MQQSTIAVYVWANGHTADEDDVRAVGGLDNYMTIMGLSDDYETECHSFPLRDKFGNYIQEN